jgi:ribonuclease BN (tRNA processing enzyme)
MAIAVAAGAAGAGAPESVGTPPWYRTSLTLLGIAGGRTSYRGVASAGISSAVVVDGDVYLVDFGAGWLRRYVQAGLGGFSPGAGLEKLRAAFITHLHANHVVDYPSLFLFGASDGLSERKTPVRIFGPGSRGSLVRLEGRDEKSVPVVAADRPTPGTAEMTESLYRAFATDINDNIRDSRKPDPHSRLDVLDINIPAGIVRDPNVDSAPSMEPFVVY